MSLGSSPIDFISCIHLANRVLRRCRDASEEFRAITTLVSSLQLLLGEVQESVSGHELSDRRKYELKQLMIGCNEVLMDLQSLLYKHKNLGNQSKRGWNGLSWGRDPVENIRQRIIARIGLLTAFNVSIISASQARVQKLLQQLLFEHQAGLCERSIISSDNVKSAEEGNEEAWFHIGRELEDVGITSVMIRDHRQYIIRWIKHALKIGKLNEGGDLPRVVYHNPSTTAQEHEKSVAVTERSLSIRTVSSQTQHISEAPRDPRKSTTTMSGLSADSFPEQRNLTRPGDIRMSDKEWRHYRCAHVYCEGRRNRFYTWFQLLLHARIDHATGRTPWSKYHSLDSEERDVNHSSLLCVNDSGRYLASSTPYANIPADQDRDEVAYFLAHLYRAVRAGSIPVEVPQLLYDLYYSTRCSFSDCRVTSRSDHEHREHFLGHFQSCEAQHDRDPPSDSGANSTSLQTMHRVEALARVQKKYAYPSQERTTSNRGFCGLGIFKRSKQSLQRSSSASSPGASLPYRTIFSGQSIESIVGASAAESARVSLKLHNWGQPSPRPKYQPSYNQNHRYSRPTAFSLIPDFQVAQDHGKRTDSDFTLSTTGGSNDCEVSSHALSSKLMASQAEREGVLFIMASLRQTLGTSK